MERRRLRGFIAAVLLAGALVAPAAPAAACSLNYQYIWTLDVSLEVPKDSYPVGSKVPVKVTVVRPAKHDPLGNGIPIDPPRQDPAPDVSVGVGFYLGDYYFNGAGVTDANGEVIVKVKIKDYAEPGPVDVSVFATRYVAEDPARCFVIYEVGDAFEAGVFKAT